jgi:hypothetical protein
MIAAAGCLFVSAASAAEPKLIGHWPLTKDARDASGDSRHGTALAVEFAATGATFNGRSSRIDIAAAPQLATGDFSISLWVHTEAQLDDAIGDLISQYDSATRTGLSLSIKHHAGVTGSQANFRRLEFGIDQGRQDAEWRDEGRPGKVLCLIWPRSPSHCRTATRWGPWWVVAR